MGKDMNQYVLSILENYPEMSRRIELMRYELHSSMVTSLDKGTQPFVVCDG